VARSASNPSDAGFVLLNAALEPLYINTCAAEILFHPDAPNRTKDFPDQVASKIRAMVANGGPGDSVSICHEFRSGNRRYVCRLFSVELPVNGTTHRNGARGSSLAVLLERRPRVSLDMRKICRQYKLTPREGQSVECLLHGLASKEIAVRMGISPNTVKVFLRLAMVKMGVTSRSGIMSKFIQPPG
jgi:DNA-binding CsgD family transcriptional regulator